MCKVNKRGLTLSCCPWLKHRVSSCSRRRRENKTPSRAACEPSSFAATWQRVADIVAFLYLSATLPGRAADRFGSPACDPAIKHQEAPGWRERAYFRRIVQKLKCRHYWLAPVLFETCMSFFLLWNAEYDDSPSLYSLSLNGIRCNGSEWWLS